MKKIIVIGSLILTFGLLAGFAAPVYAHELETDDLAPQYRESWQTMYEACKEGDWEAMVEAAEEFHEVFDYTSCHGYYPDKEADSASFWGGMMGRGWGGHMGRGMMGF